MITTKTFKSGNSLAIRLPRDLGFEESEEVEIYRKGEEVIIRHKSTSLKKVFDLLSEMPSDFMEEDRVDNLPEERDF